MLVLRMARQTVERIAGVHQLKRHATFAPTQMVVVIHLLAKVEYGSPIVGGSPG